jgi:DNA-binding GntR family transcriptional regulator
MDQIRAGKYPLGSLLPKERDLSARYGVSRHTMREALRRLRDSGIVSRRRRAGTEVVATAQPLSYRQPIGSINDLLQYGEGTEVKVLRKARIACDAALAASLGCEVGREWLLVETIRTCPGDPRPICFTSNYLNLDLLTIEEAISDLSSPISAMLETRYGLRITAIEQSIQAVRLDKAAAQVLLSRTGSPALRSVRRYYDETARLLEQSSAIHAGDRFTYVMRLTRDLT